MAHRNVSWRLYCPRCLTPYHEPYQHTGIATKSHALVCGYCRKPFSVTTYVNPRGVACCEAKPVFIRAPEVITDSAPPVAPPR